MKKTIISLVALCGVAAAETVVFDFGRTDSDSYKTSGAITIGTNATAYQNALEASGTLGSITGSYSYIQEASSGNFNNSATLTYNEEANWKNHLQNTPTGWESTFADGLTSQWNGSQGNKHTLTLTNLAGGIYDLSILGGYYGKDKLATSITLTIGGTSVTTDKTQWTSYDIAGAQSYTTQGVATYTTTLTNGTANEGYTYDIQGIYVKDGGSLTFTITGDTNAGNRTPLNGLKLTYASIPEPTTATLSLLALAGLAARRRRK